MSSSGRGPRRAFLLVVASASILAAGCASAAVPATTPAAPAGEIRIGAAFPLAGNARPLANEELAGVQAAADFVNADGGIDGRRIVLDVRDLERGSDAPSVMATFKAEGATVVIGAYSSQLSVPASLAASDAGLVYWEAGAVADQLTGRGLPMVFRVGASGTNLGASSATFAMTQLAGPLARTPAQLRLAIVAANDAYAQSVADAAAATAVDGGAPIVARATYNPTLPDWPAVMDQLRSVRPDVIILASHIPDGIEFRRAMLEAKVHVGALIGSTMAECDPDFAGELGPDAIGIFASDRPTGGFQPSALDPAARSLYDRFSAAWAARDRSPARPRDYGAAGAAGAAGATGTPATAEYAITGPVEAGSPAAGPSEEGLSGFSAAWALFHDVLPAAARSGSLEAAAVAAAARSVDLPTGSLPNGAGIRFSTGPATLGQNLRAAAVIWQWQAVRSYTFVWPPTYRTGEIAFVPLGR